MGFLRELWKKRDVIVVLVEEEEELLRIFDSLSNWIMWIFII